MVNKKCNRTALLKTFLTCCGILILTFLFLGSDCREILPVYEEPANVYSVELNFPIGDPSRIRMDIDRIMLGISPISFSIVLKNIYQETISGMTPQSLGRLEIWWDNDPNVKRTIDITSDDEWRTNEFSPYLPVTFDAGDSSLFMIAWYDWQDNRGTNMWEFTAQGVETSDATYIYKNKTPMDFTAQAILTPILHGPTAYTREFNFTVTFFQVEPK